MKAKAIFLDRDGTINHDPGYLSQVDQCALLPGVKAGLSLLQQLEYLFIVVTNQSGIGRGLFSRERLNQIHQRMDELLSPVKITHYAFCPHHPQEGCSCRKPHPQLILQAARDWGIDLRGSYMIGDKVTDLQAGYQAGCRSLLVKTGAGSRECLLTEASLAVKICDSLYEAAQWIATQR